ncbi:YigZ family protein [Candidatus Poribacteria bacterium]|nr:MAG: YigZ family protein [Candidatus Poribacteria bacterium]
MFDQYKTVVGIAEAHHVVKKSRFFGEAAAVRTQAEVKEFLAQVQKRNPRASHYCYAYSIGSGDARREYATDAGEPTHSAGPPILAAVRGFGLSNVICVVARYYGGINLGVGGLIRAYGQCARDCLQNATIETCLFYEKLYVKVNYPNIGTVVTLCKRLDGKVINIRYEPDPIVEIQIRQKMVETFQAQLQGYGIGL